MRVYSCIGTQRGIKSTTNMHQNHVPTNLCFQRFRRMSDFVAVVGHFIQCAEHDCIGGTAQHLHGRRRHAQHAHDANALQFFVAVENVCLCRV